ncbi:hypothetical protein E3N88_31590 [Mikania micrantha]|uniref:CCHC-type domain-containing protein n=1 Tax=Mikania micrantha TaxID=192012 RepID=A0A5N6M770_9ASTR|nr:hypothetical protein E3N88_31590 [Mikania micrantha]
MAREKPEPETAREETEEIGDGSSGEGGDRDGGDGEGGDDDGEDAMSEETEAHVKRHLKSMVVLETINVNNNCSEQEKAKADVFLHKHIDGMLQFEYSNFDDPSALWKDLQERFNHQKAVLLPAARDEWSNLRLQDFKKVNDYTSALFRICSILRFCWQNVTEEDMLEKTFSTFHSLNAACKQANAISHNDAKTFKHTRGHGRGHCRGRFDKNRFNHPFKWNNKYNGRGPGSGRGRGRSQRANNYHNLQNENQQYKFQNEVGTSQHNDISCFRCGSKNHWSKVCRTPSHLCKLYQASLKEKEKEVNHVDKFDDANAELNNLDFLPNLEI